MLIEVNPKTLPDFGEIERIVVKAFRETTLIMDATFKEVISDPGAFPEFPGQDIVDTGQLRASQQFNFLGNERALFSWPVEYSLYVHEGYTLRNGREQPGRPWTEEGVRRKNPQDVFNRLVEVAL